MVINCLLLLSFLLGPQLGDVSAVPGRTRSSANQPEGVPVVTVIVWIQLGKLDEIRNSLGRTGRFDQSSAVGCGIEPVTLLAPFPGIKLEADSDGAQAEIVKNFHLAMFADASLDLGASPVRASESTNVMVAKVSNLQNISSLFICKLLR
jgi:hypothetical protein